MEDLNDLHEKLARYEKRERELEQRVEELTDFLENASLPLHWVDADGKIIWANQAELDALGYTKDEYIGHPISDFHADKEAIDEILNRLKNNETLKNYPATLRCKDNTIRHVLINSNVLFKDGKFIHTRCFTRDITELKKEEEKKTELLIKLEESEARLSMLMKSINIGTWDFNPLSGELYWSEECKNIYGFPASQEVTFQLFEDYIYPDDKEFALREIQRSLDPAEPGNYDITFRIIRFNDKSVRWVRSQGKVYHNFKQQPERFIGTVVDITESKLAEEKAASLAAIIESSDDAIISKTLEGIVVSWNNSAQRIFGYTAAEMIGQPILKLIPYDRQDEEPQILGRLKKGERVDHFETQRVTKDNRILDISLTISPVKDSQGNVIGVSKIARDITEKRQAERLLSEREEHLRLAIQAADLGTFDMDLVKGTLDWDARCRELFGIHTNKKVEYEHDFLNGLHPDDRDRIKKAVEEVFDKNKTDGTYDVEYRTIGLEDKKLRWVRAIGKTFFDERDKPFRFMGAVLDISDKKEEELRKNDFIAIVSHELKTPLTSIKSYVQILLAKARQEGESFKTNALARTEVQIKKMDTLIKDFLSLASIEEARIKLNKELFGLQPLLEEIIDDAYFTTSIHNIQIKGCDVKINADKEKIGQVLTNLLSNAIKYSPKGGNIVIGCEKIKDKVKIYISDEGVGINRNHQRKLFDRFYRVENEKVKTVSGFGVGLYLVSEILRYHDTTIEVESTEGSGSTFYFHLDAEINQDIAVENNSLV